VSHHQRDSTVLAVNQTHQTTVSSRFLGETFDVRDSHGSRLFRASKAEAIKLYETGRWEGIGRPCVKYLRPRYPTQSTWRDDVHDLAVAKRIKREGSPFGRPPSISRRKQTDPRKTLPDPGRGHGLTRNGGIHRIHFDRKKS
jgi:hypothetical protein